MGVGALHQEHPGTGHEGRPLQVETALRYYADYPDEVDDRIRLDDEYGQRAQASWQRRQTVLG